MSLAKKYQYSFLLGFSLFSGIILFNPSNALAQQTTISSVFPNCANEEAGECTGNNDVKLYAVVANNDAIDSESSTTKIFVPNGWYAPDMKVRIVVVDACVQLPRDSKNSSISADVFEPAPGTITAGPSISNEGEKKYYTDDDGGNPDRGECENGGRDFVFNVRYDKLSDSQNGRFPDFKTALVVVKRIDRTPGDVTSRGNKHFKVLTSLGYATMDDLGSQNADASPSAADLAGPLNRRAFNIRNIRFDGGRTDEGETSMRFVFKTDCEYQNGRPVYFKWFDADWDTQAEWSSPDNPSKNINFAVNGSPGGTVMTAGGTTPADGAEIGGSLASKQKPVSGGLNRDVVYEWKWQQVQRMNGVQLWMPFSEIGPLLDCDKPPEGKITNLSCKSITVRGRDGNYSDNELVHWRIKLTNLGGETLLNSNDPGVSRTSWNNPTKKDFPFKDYKGADNKVRIVLQIQDKDTNNWNDSPDPDDDKTIICPVLADALLTCDIMTINNNRLPNDWKNGRNDRKYRFVAWVANEPFGEDIWPGNPGWDNAAVLDFVVDNDNNPDASHSLTQGEGLYNLQRSGNVYYQLKIFHKLNNNNDNNESNWERIQTYRDGSVDNPCYQANCTMQVTSSFGSNRVRANESFQVDVTVANIGGNRWKEGSRIGLYSGSGNYGWNDGAGQQADADEEIYPGNDREFSFNLTAPSSVSLPRLHLDPGFWWLSGVTLGGDQVGCDQNINVFEYFTVNANALPVPASDWEDPSNINFQSWANQVSGPTVTGVVNGKRDRGTSEISSTNTGNLPLSPDLRNDYTPYDPRPVSAGERFCVYTNIYINGNSGYTMNPTGLPATGWKGSGADDYLEVRNANQYGCNTTENKPYMRVYGNDLYAGSGFTNSAGCTTNSAAAVRGYRSSDANKLGSGAQLAILANDIIDGYMSSAVRSFAGDDYARAPAGLSFANTSADAAVNNYGGYFGVSFCATNFFDTTQYEDTDSTKKTVLTGNQTLSADSLDKLQTLIKEGDLNFTGGIIEDRRAVYVEGDVYISDNIGHDSAARSNFAMIVKGNIYVGKNVRLLDGLYVAQPRADGTGGGTIYTCAESLGNPVDKTQLYNECGGAQKDDAVAGNERQLVVYGAFIAQDVKFLRTHGSLRDTSRSSEGDNINNAAELFRFSPELYLTFPAFKPRPLGGAGIFDYITTLPPIL